MGQYRFSLNRYDIPVTVDSGYGILKLEISEILIGDIFLLLVCAPMFIFRQL